MNRKEQNNIGNFMILPMLQLNKSSFGTDNFINTLIDKDGYIIVNTKKEPEIDFTSHEYYATDFDDEDGSLLIVFECPSKYKDDLNLFIEGKYSEMSEDLKSQIKKYSGLKDSSSVIKTLNPTKETRQIIADELGVKVDLIKETRSAPNEFNFIKIK